MSIAWWRTSPTAPEQIFGAPKEERTRAFLKSIIEAGRL
jgi:hypothetical protein